MRGEKESLRGKRVLVVEDDYMLADEIAEALAEVGAVVLGPVRGVTEALSLLRDEGSMDVALLDVNVGGEFIWPVADVLAGREVPFMLTTGYGSEMIPPAYSGATRCEKPVGVKIMIHTLISIMTKG